MCHLLFPVFRGIGAQKKESIHILIDSTGLKIYGAGEWEEAKHGKGRRKGWMKLHLAIDENSKEIEASTLTDHLTSDASQVKSLLDNVDSKIGDVKADGAYDYDSVLQVLKDLEIKGKGIFLQDPMRFCLKTGKRR